MDIGLWLKDWATPLSAIATLAAVIVALGLGVASIVQTQRLQKRERRERLLNEIIEWAEDVSARMSPVDILKNPEWVLGTKLDSEEKFRFLQIYGLLDLVHQYAVSDLYGEYISQIASRVRKDLGKAVHDLIIKIEKHLEVLLDGAEHTVKLEEYSTLIDIFFKGKSELRDGLSEDAKHQLHVFDDRVELNKSATRVIEIATKIKAEGIS
jgi:hypothetical protein